MSWSLWQEQELDRLWGGGWGWRKKETYLQDGRSEKNLNGHRQEEECSRRINCMWTNWRRERRRKARVWVGGPGRVVLSVGHPTGQGCVLISWSRCPHRAWHRACSSERLCRNNVAGMRCAWFGVESEGGRIRRPGHWARILRALTSSGGRREGRTLTAGGSWAFHQPFALRQSPALCHPWRRSVRPEPTGSCAIEGAWSALEMSWS